MTHLHPQTSKYDTPEKISDLLHSISSVYESQGQLSEKIRETSHSIETYEAQVSDLRQAVDLKDRRIEQLEAEITRLKAEGGGRSPEDFLAELGGDLEVELKSAEEKAENSRFELARVREKVEAIESAKQAFGL